MQLRHNKPDFDADITYYIIQKNEKKYTYNTYSSNKKANKSLIVYHRMLPSYIIFSFLQKYLTT